MLFYNSILICECFNGFESSDVVYSVISLIWLQSIFAILYKYYRSFILNVSF